MMIHWSWSVALQEWYLSTMRHPKILLFSLAILIFIAYLRCLNRSCKTMVNWPVVGMLPSIFANNHRLLDLAASSLQEFGYTFMFKGPRFCGMDFLLTCNPANANHMFNVNFSNYPKGAGFSEMFDILGDGIFNVDGDSWVVQRRMAHAHMSHPRFRSSVVQCIRDKVVRVLLPLLNHMVEFDKVVDLSDIFMRFTFDTTCTLVLGEDPGCLASDFPIVPFAKALDDVENVLLFRHVLPKIWWKSLRWLGVGKERNMAEAKKVVDHFIAKRIQERRESRKMNQEGSSNNEQGPIDLLGPYMDHFMENVGEHSNSSISNDKFLRDTLLTFLGAGKDTTAAALVWFFWLVANNPNIKRKILNELREVHALLISKERSSLDDKMLVFNFEDIDSLVYLHASLCETLRMYPPVPFNHKEALKADILPSGQIIQPGTKVIFSAYTLGRMEDLWGTDCLEFKPERWITEKGMFKQEASYKFIAFHSGPRSCLGKTMAFVQMKVVAAAVIYNYNIELVEGHITEPKPSIVLQTKNGLMVRIKKRRINEFHGDSSDGGVDANYSNGQETNKKDK